MTSIIKIHPFSGVFDESPPCYLLQVDEFRFLLDCGWDEHFNMDFIKEIRKYISQIDAVLISYPDCNHLGALPYLVGKCGLSCPVYATTPVYKMGQMFMYDLHQSHSNSEEFDTFTLDDVDAAFDKIQQVKYSQNVSMKGKGHGLVITPLPAGHMIGGTIWKIVKDGEEDIVYAVDYNHKKERHLNGCILDSISKPHLLITDAYNAIYEHERRRKRDEQLLTHIVSTVRADGNVLVAVDTAGRVLELVHLLDQLWQAAESGLLVYSLAFLNNVSYNVVEFAKSQVEWMSDKIMSSFETTRNNPFHFKHVQMCHSLADIKRLPSPKVVLASVWDMSCGFSRDLFIDWCESGKNTVILTCRTPPGTLARQLIDDTDVTSVTVEVKKRVRLQGEELEQFVAERKKREEEEENDMKASMLSDDSDVDSDVEPGGGGGGDAEPMDVDASATPGHTTAPRVTPRVRKWSESRGGGGGHTGGSQHMVPAGLHPRLKRNFLMYPHVESRVKWDDYGEMIRPEDFIKDPSVLDDHFHFGHDRVNQGLVNGDDPGAAKAHSLGAAGGRGKATSISEDQPEEIPTKCVASLETLEVKCKVVYIDFEGRSDGESMKKLITACKPKQLVLVHGNRAATMHLAEHCRNAAGIGKVYTPSLHDVVDATTDTHIYQVKLTDLLVSSLTLTSSSCSATVGGPVAQVTWLDGRVNLQGQPLADTSPTGPAGKGSDTDHHMLYNEDKDVVDNTPTVEPLPLQKVPQHPSVFLTEPRLSDFKHVLLEHGLQAEFNKGLLICNDCVSVKKITGGKVVLEGPLSPTYYRVRELLYQQYVII